MDSWVVGMMLGASLFLGGFALVAVMWGIRSGQFDDKEKMMNAMHFDNEEDLRDAVNEEKKKEELKKKKYKPE